MVITLMMRKDKEYFKLRLTTKKELRSFILNKKMSTD